MVLDPSVVPVPLYVEVVVRLHQTPVYQPVVKCKV